MNFRLHKDFSGLSAKDWNTLVEQSIADTPFSRYEYLREWWQTLGGGEWMGKGGEVNSRTGERTSPLLVLVSATENDQLIGIAPLFIAEYDSQRALMLVGSIEISDYLDLIVRMDDHARFLTGLLDFLGSSLADDWSALDWYNLPDTSPTLGALKTESERLG